MSLPESIQTPFGYALAPVNLTAASQHSARLGGDERLEATVKDLLQPVYLADGYQPRGWQRSTHLIPAATPRSCYSQPLAGGSPLPELGPGTHHSLSQDPKLAEKMPFFQDRQPPQPGPFRIGIHPPQGGKEESGSIRPPSLVVERLLPTRGSRNPKAKVIVAVHGLGSCKETFLPLLDRLVRKGEEEEEEAEDHGIHQIWLIDALGHGMTSILNGGSKTSPDDLLSCQNRIVDSNDYARDLLLFLTCYLPGALEASRGSPLGPALAYSPPRLASRKVIGLGHSFGATSLLQLGVHLPDLFESICVIEPILIRDALVEKGRKIPLARFTLMKKASWSSREEARRDLVKDRTSSSWDPRVRDAFVAGALCQGRKEEEVDRCCDRVAEALCIRGNRPGIQLATGTLRHLPSRVKVLYISCSKPLLSPLEEVRSVAEGQIANLDFETLDGSHSLPQEMPDTIADLVRSSLIRNRSTSKL
ncbi:alpha/beta-hydrolase [Violaceomyces palustris]|uniref:Alpha/beta-hydrolase n=1 Tax=Violaceomyces palustris TaxID=1673888 RepID=A0ACD0P7Z1_9BASI|nr:alpha/beta-hydrolase [Violaceomyces palustris]